MAAYSLALLRAAHQSGTVRVTFRRLGLPYTGIVTGIGSKLGVHIGDRLIEDVRAEEVEYADMAELADDIKYAYRDALESIPGATVTRFIADSMGDVPGGFVLEVAFPNGYGVSVARNGSTYGGECMAMVRGEALLREGEIPPGTDISPYNELRVDGAAYALNVARQVAALPARTEV